MSTESGKTCVECKPVQEDRGGRSFVHMVNTGVVQLCPLHDGSMAEKLAEALRRKVTHHDNGINCALYGSTGQPCSDCQLLAAYDELQGRKG